MVRPAPFARHFVAETIGLRGGPIGGVKMTFVARSGGGGVTGRMKSMMRFAALALLPAASLAAQTASSDPDTLSLSDAQKQELLAHNTESSVDAARAGLGRGPPVRQIHGEIGAMIGSHGSRGIYGSAAVPLGDNADAAFSFEDSRYGYGRRR